MSWETMRRFEARRHKTPSDLLFNNVDANGEALTLEEAMRLIIAQSDEGMLEWRHTEPDEFLSRHDIDRAITDLAALKGAATEARTRYLMTLQLTGNEDEAREAVIAAFEASDNDWDQLIVEAVRRSNYSGLSV